MDRIGDTAKKGFDFIKGKALETVEMQKTRSQLKDLEERRQRCLSDMGHRVLAAYESEDFSKDMFADRVAETHELTEQIRQAETKLEEHLAHLKSTVDEIMPKKPIIPPPNYE